MKDQSINNVMDINPPPQILTKQEKKRLKRKRYKERRMAKKSQGPLRDIAAPPEERNDIAPSNMGTEELRQKLRGRMNGLTDQRTGVAQQKLQILKNTLVGKTGKINVNQLMDKMGINDPVVQAKMLKMAQSGHLKDHPAVQKYMDQIMA